MFLCVFVCVCVCVCVCAFQAAEWRTTVLVTTVITVRLCQRVLCNREHVGMFTIVVAIAQVQTMPGNCLTFRTRVVLLIIVRLQRHTNMLWIRFVHKVRDAVQLLHRPCDTLCDCKEYSFASCHLPKAQLLCWAGR